jgi:Arc/MetJ-type ribon-helix-helix transcriptional regulator
MKVSVSLPTEDVEFLDEYARSRGFQSRSAVLHTAVSLLRIGDLAGAYEDAWTSWDSSSERDLWDVTASDGISA